jgi:hypothetical protein
VADLLNRAPGVYRQDVFPTPEPGFLTGVPVFLGYAVDGPDQLWEPQLITLWPQFETTFGGSPEHGYLADAVRGFFENDGLRCYVLRLEPWGGLRAEHQRGLEAIAVLDDADLVCAPDVMFTGDPQVDPDPHAVAAMQRDILDSCHADGHRFAILDAVPRRVTTQRADLDSDHGALYHPWVWTQGPDRAPRYVPPCGHVAGAYSRSDRAVGVHKAPANEVIEGVLDLQANLGDRDVGGFNEAGINCLRAFPGRGVRVWGARTLSADPAWRYVNVRRVLLTMERWLERFMGSLVHEPNDVRLWVHIMRDLAGYLEGLYQRGALKGRTPEEAFYVKCDHETNPPDVIDAGMVVTEIGVAPVAPAEFVVVRIIHGSSGVSITPTSTEE